LDNKTKKVSGSMSKYKDDIIRLRKQKKSYREIENELDCSKGTIAYHCRQAGLEDVGNKRRISEEKKAKIREYRKSHTSSETAKKFDVSRASVEKHADEKLEKQTLEGTERECRFCSRVYTYERGKGHRRNTCNGCNTKIRRTRNKLRAINYLGGECSKCGYDKYISALEFHHTGNKSFSIGAVANKSWQNTIKPELEECVILCSNCHRAEHSNRFSEQFIEQLVEEDKLKDKLANMAR
jgi:DNA-binding CsgD family transcriptional regulator/5-methylcytosine-specific restriction endonuclease McrA